MSDQIEPAGTAGLPPATGGWSAGLRPAYHDRRAASRRETTQSRSQTGAARYAGRSRRRAYFPTAGLERHGLFQPVPAWIWAVAAVGSVIGLMMPNGWLTSLAVLTMPVLAALLWFRGEPPVLLFACSMQWLSASTAVFYSDFHGYSLESVFGGPQMAQASLLSLTAVLTLACGMRLALLRRRPRPTEEAEREAGTLNPAKLFFFYLAAAVVFSLLARLAWRVSALTQPLLALTTLRWVLVFLLAYGVLTQRRGYPFLAAMVGLEFFSGIIGFFSGFKSVFFILIVVLLSSREGWKGRRLAAVAGILATVLLLGSVWSVVKEEYRSYLNQGSGMQEVVVPVPQRLAKMSELVAGLTPASFRTGVDRLILRVSYVNYFALTMLNVPGNIPYERGKMWMEAVQHVLMPRFLNPDKPAVHDSLRTQFYADVKVAGPGEGTSIGIGYVGESYIDFGPVGLHAPIFLLGMFYGFIYRWFADRTRHPLLGQAIGTSILIFGATSLADSNIKLVGGNLMGLLVLGTFTLIAGRWFWNAISTQPLPRRRR